MHIFILVGHGDSSLPFSPLLSFPFFRLICPNIFSPLSVPVCLHLRLSSPLRLLSLPCSWLLLSSGCQHSPYPSFSHTALCEPVTTFFCPSFMFSWLLPPVLLSLSFLTSSLPLSDPHPAAAYLFPQQLSTYFYFFPFHHSSVHTCTYLLNQ